MKSLLRLGFTASCLGWLPAAGSAQSAAMTGFTAASSAAERQVEQRFDAGLDPRDLRAWLEAMSSQPNQVGSPHDKANAEFMRDQLRSWGWETNLETFYVLYPTPTEEAVELVSPSRFRAKLHEPAVPGDRTSGRTAGALPPYNVYGADGDVTAPLVYVDFGMPDDYLRLDRLGVSVRGKIVIARYGGGWRGLKPKLAYQHGAIGCIIYSDPHEDGYAQGDVYPAGPFRPPDGVQRGSVEDMTLYSGDPLTPGVGATQDAPRLPLADAATILRIPVIPISYSDAQPLLAAIGGPVAPETWRGSLPLTYHVGPGPAQVHLKIKSDWSLKPIYDVIAVMRGSAYPDEWVLRGNHHDGWVFGAWDPLAGNVSLLEEAKSIGSLVRSGWRPKRTLIYTGWDGEEPGLLGSTEWAEEHADELRQKAVLYINSDTNGRGFLKAGGSHGLQRLVNEVASEVRDPESGFPVGARCWPCNGSKRLKKAKGRPAIGSFSKPWVRARISPPFCSTWGSRPSRSSTAGRMTITGSTIPPTIPSIIISGSPIPISPMESRWLKRSGGPSSGRPMPMSSPTISRILPNGSRPTSPRCSSLRARCGAATRRSPGCWNPAPSGPPRTRSIRSDPPRSCRRCPTSTGRPSKKRPATSGPRPIATTGLTPRRPKRGVWRGPGQAEAQDHTLQSIEQTLLDPRAFPAVNGTSI